MKRKLRVVVAEEQLLNLIIAEPPREEHFAYPQLLLSWNEEGLLPYHEITMTTAQLIDSPFVTGLGSRPGSWNQELRRTQTKHLIQRAKTLSLLGVKEIIVSGEYVEEIGEPNGVLAYFPCDLRALTLPQLEVQLSVMDPGNSWKWAQLSPSGRLPMWDQHKIEIYPFFCTSEPDGPFLEIRPRSHFHLNRQGSPKGVIRLQIA